MGQRNTVRVALIRSFFRFSYHLLHQSRHHPAFRHDLVVARTNSKDRRRTVAMRTRISLSLMLKSVVVLLFCFGLVWSLRHRPGSKFDPFHAGQIKPGMTVEQAVSILDDPP